jgi:sugar (glycoside-pentoside-hexuronide) transporter
MAKLEQPGAQSTLAERVSYGAYFLGQNIFYMLLIFFLMPFCTDIGIPVGVVGIIMLAVRVFDAVNDPVFGAIVDKSRLKSGKFIPWLRISLIGIPVFSILIFLTPAAMPVGTKIAWVAVTYTFWSMAYTVCDVPIFGIITALTGDGHERTLLISIGRVFGVLGACVAMAVLPVVRQSIGGWFPTALVLAAAAFIFMTPICLIAKERVPPPPSQEAVTAKALFNFVFKNKYLLIFYGGMILAYGGNIGSSLGMYLARYNLHGEQYMGLLNLLTFLPSAVLGALIPFITKKADKFKVLFICVLVTPVLNIIAYFAGYDNITLFMVLTFIKGIPFGGIFMFMFMFTPDFAEYGRYKTGISAVGVAFSIQTFTAKLVGAITGALASVALAAIGFVEGEGAVQAAGFEGKLWVLYYIIPAIALLLSIPVFMAYKPRDKHIAIMARCNRGEISREEAEELIGVKL